MVKPLELWVTDCIQISIMQTAVAFIIFICYVHDVDLISQQWHVMCNFLLKVYNFPSPHFSPFTNKMIVL
jgi:hypothetical protein